MKIRINFNEQGDPYKKGVSHYDHDTEQISDFPKFINCVFEQWGDCIENVEITPHQQEGESNAQ